MEKFKLFLLITILNMSVFNLLPVHAETEETLEGASNIQTIDGGYGFDIDLSGDYLFDFDQAILTVKAKRALHRVLDIYKQHEGFQMQISGHTDSKGSESYNQDLSERRAERVYEWFLGQGIPSDSLSQIGYGESQPVASNEEDGQDNPLGRALNRRVEIKAKTHQKIEKLPTAEPPKPTKPSAPRLPSKPNPASKPNTTSKPSVSVPSAPSKPILPTKPAPPSDE